MQTLTKISVEDYLAEEKQAPSKNEYHDGEIVAMAGAQEPHNVIVNNLIFLINRCLWEKNCRVYPSDMLLKLEKCHKYVYPDIMIVCEKPKLEKHSGLDVLLNPIVIIEVLSESTGNYDQIEKKNCYLELESLQEYIMIDSETISLTSYKRKNKHDWLYQISKNIKDQAKIYDCEIALEDIYRNVDFEEESK